MGFTIGRGGLSAEWIANCTGGTVYKYSNGCKNKNVLCAEDAVIRGVGIDTRTLTPGEIFIAIHGERFDGHDYIETALRRGAYTVICEGVPDGVTEGSFITVPDTGKALLDIAKAYKSQFHGLKLTAAVTGSVGKTTTKQFIYSVLSTKYNTHKTPANFNNLIGLPQTVLMLSDEHEAAVFEMGMNSKNEISQMSCCVNPDIGVITNIGTAHIGMLGSREAIRDAKLEITDGFTKKSILIKNGDEPLLDEVPGERVSFCDSSAEVFIYDIRQTGNGMSFDLELYGADIDDLYIPVIGKHNVFNAAVACAVGDHAGLSCDELRHGLMSFENTGSRQHIFEYNGITVIDDCYNASPEAMAASLSVLKTVSEEKCSKGIEGRRVAVLGDMLELGNRERELHIKTGEVVRKNKIDMLYTVGENAKLIALGGEYGLSENFGRDEAETERLSEELKRELRQGDVVLFKASHSVGLQNVINKVFATEAEP